MTFFISTLVIWPSVMVYCLIFCIIYLMLKYIIIYIDILISTITYNTIKFTEEHNISICQQLIIDFDLQTQKIIFVCSLIPYKLDHIWSCVRNDTQGKAGLTQINFLLFYTNFFLKTEDPGVLVIYRNNFPSLGLNALFCI